AQAILAGGPTYDGAAHASQARDAVERGEVPRALRRAWTAYYYAARTGARDPSWERQLIRTSLSVSPSG
ncbi:MAG TPA: hypothetical protein PKA64_05765, partial [Myxococcota bacterium]|nr:hypothetical protein [Myxococcota bacterium]